MAAAEATVRDAGIEQADIERTQRARVQEQGLPPFDEPDALMLAVLERLTGR